MTEPRTSLSVDQPILKTLSSSSRCQSGSRLPLDKRSAMELNRPVRYNAWKVMSKISARANNFFGAGIRTAARFKLVWRWWPYTPKVMPWVHPQSQSPRPPSLRTKPSGGQLAQLVQVFELHLRLTLSFPDIYRIWQENLSTYNTYVVFDKQGERDLSSNQQDSERGVVCRVVLWIYFFASKKFIFRKRRHIVVSYQKLCLKYRFSATTLWTSSVAAGQMKYIYTKHK